MYQHARTRTGAVAPVDYSALAQGIEVSESHSAIAELQASNPSIEKEAFVYMTNTPEETTRRLEPQAQVQREQFDMKGKARPPYISRRRGNPILSRLSPHLKRNVIQRMRVLILKE